MKCRQIQKKISVLMDGELNQSQVEMVQNHLKVCIKCSQVYQRWIKTREVLDVLPMPAPEPYFHTKLNARLNTEHKQRPGWADRIMLPVSTAAMIALGIFLGSLAGKNGDSLAGESVQVVMAESIDLDHLKDVPELSLGEVFFELNGDIK